MLLTAIVAYLMRLQSSTYTTLSGYPLDNVQASLKIGPNIQSPLLIRDINLIETIAHATEERVPERVVHAKGGGAGGYFECTSDEIQKYTKANFLSQKGKQTPLRCRFSTVAGGRGSPDTVRDTRGFAFKMYTQEGNLDWLFFSEPVFPIRDGGEFHSSSEGKGSTNIAVSFDKRHVSEVHLIHSIALGVITVLPCHYTLCHSTICE